MGRNSRMIFVMAILTYAYGTDRRLHPTRHGWNKVLWNLATGVAARVMRLVDRGENLEALTTNPVRSKNVN